MQNLPTEDFMLIPNVINIIKLVAVNPAPSATAERAFSLARNLKTWLWSTMLAAKSSDPKISQRANWKPESTKCCS